MRCLHARWRSGLLASVVAARAAIRVNFRGGVTVAETCTACGLDLRRHEKGDGPAFFAITIIGTLVCALAAFVELLYAPPYWLHALLWLPASVMGVLLCLRWAKGVIIAMQYKHRVDEFAHDD